MTAEASEPLAFNPFDPGFRSDPYPLYRRLREEQPRHLSPLGFWVLSRHEDCLGLLKDRRMSSDESRSATFQQSGSLRRVHPEGGEPPLGEEARPFLFMDPPDHTRLRGLVSKAFTARVVERLEPRVQELVDDLLDAALEKPEIELIEDLAYPLPVRVISEMLGVPAEDHETFKSWSAALARGLDPDMVLPPEVIERREQAVVSFTDYFGGLIAERRSSPGDDLLSALVLAEDGGEVLSETELLSTCILLLVAGHETTVNLIGNGTLALLRHPDQLDALRAGPSLARGAIEELLRFDPPVQLTGRIALEPVDLGQGTVIEEGQFAMLLLASANRDPSVFADPDRLDLGRADNRHLSFGFGIHFCLGAPLARLEGRIAITSLLRRARRLELVDEEPSYKENIVLRGLESLRVGVGEAVAAGRRTG
jgi:cytochrome P450